MDPRTLRDPSNGSLEGPQEFFTKAKFEKNDLVFLITSISLLVKEKYMQTHADHYYMDPRTLRDPSNGSLGGPKEFFTKAKIQNWLGLFDHLLLMMFILVYCFNKVIDCFFETPVDFLLKNSRMKKSDMYLTFLHVSVSCFYEFWHFGFVKLSWGPP